MARAPARRQRGVSVKRRLSLAMDVWEEILSEYEQGSSIDRGRAVAILKRLYEAEGVEPLRGASTPPDLYEKELATLYVVGKHGMGVDKSHPELFDRLFSDEVRYEEAIRILLTSPPEEARMRVEALLGGKLDDNTVARMLRLKLTEMYFGFVDEESFERLLRALVEAFPEKKKLASKYARFYIAFRIADAIQKGEVRDRITKEAMKQALALRLNYLEKTLPDDDYIRKIAGEVFSVPQHLLKMILSGGRRGDKKGDRRPS